MAVKKFDENSNSHEKLSARESTARTRVVITHQSQVDPDNRCLDRS
jgi:hypothetical protein